MNPQKRLVDALKARTPILGSWLQSGSPAAAEILSAAGYAWLGLDCEHTSADIATVEDVARALAGRNTALLVRVSQCATIEIRRCLDVGAGGVIIPMVESAEQARSAVAAAKFPPLGHRGYCFGRMNDWGANFDDHARSANDDTVVMAMIETRAGVEHLDEILAVDGLNGIFIGPYDLSGSYGVPGQLGHAVVRHARETAIDACRAAGLAVGEHLVRADSEKVQAAIADGVSFLCLDADTIFLGEAARKALEMATGLAV